MDAVLMINSQLGQRAAAEVSGIKNKVKASMRAVIRENWMATRDEELFRAGLGGALLDLGTESEDGKRLHSSIQAMRRFSAFLEAAQAGLSVDVESIKAEGEMLPLMKWWHEVKAEK